ncbi:EF hand family protein [Trichomonas vaginalis G3]|uniref:EF hand family protein n=1 Tax=Trichomonas vaginalis (strain ATCC PRA-98 / G3) TaxID=412133 RepID=A2ERW3_TRIV3|nr:calcium-binding protein family [Trichomonas vaginalis G3]EAY04630.1 EF hand family protein [Trichomonas vaginalis G3]KAI5539607.1 calcium-binding protein family [Trichomonas vaginalis G3]|eukprot:XP_001316853.1 EF hand family protein [Trichomonas vaginalis G3]
MSDEERIKAIEARFDALDEGRDGKMKPAEFKVLYDDLEGRETTREESDIMFRGIDIDGSGEITKKEFMDMVNAIVKKDEKYQYKMIFRAFDKDRSRSIDVNEIIAIQKFRGKEVTKEEVQKFLLEETGKSTGKLNFALFYKCLTGKFTPKETDPYDGMLKSKCCLLI